MLAKVSQCVIINKALPGISGMGIFDRLERWRDERLTKQWVEARHSAKLLAQVDTLPEEAGYQKTRSAVGALLVDRTPPPNATLLDLTKDQTVHALGEWNLELRHPVRGIAGNPNNPFISHIQWMAEELPSLPLETPEHIRAAAQVVSIYDRIPEDWRSDFLDVVVGSACRLDWTAKEAGVESAARIISPRRQSF